ncbi:MAG: divalent metal cation transporter, partial [Steroidobacteraceae bacterium]
HLLLTPLVGTALASGLFAIALLCSGQSSTLTGTMAGQIVMEGFLNLRMRPWLRRLITRTLAIIPAALTVYSAGDRGTYELLILSQVILSLQLPFAVIPLIHFTSDRQRMGEFVSPLWIQALAWAAAALILVLNFRLAWLSLREWTARPGAAWLWLPLGPLLAALTVLLAWVTLEPVLPASIRHLRRPAPPLSPTVAENLTIPAYRKILVPLDHSARDRVAITHAAALARSHHAKLYLLHVEEGVTSQLYGPLSSTAEVEEGNRYFNGIARSLEEEGIEVDLAVLYSNSPNTEIVHYARTLQPDLIVMGAHGHKGLKDIALGNTINVVRHALDMPILVVRAER